MLDAATQPDDGHIGEVRATAIGSRKIHDKPTQIDIPHALKRRGQALTCWVRTRALQPLGERLRRDVALQAQKRRRRFWRESL